MGLAARNQCDERDEIIASLPSWRCPIADLDFLYSARVRRDRMLPQLAFR
jgi:hypothetical protein